MSTDLEKRPAVAKTEASDILTAIMQLVSDPKVDVEKMERLMAMHERIVERNARVAFDAALSRIQARLQPIQQSGVIMNKAGTAVRSRFAPLEDIDAVVRPLLSEEGFAFSIDAEEMPSGRMKLIGKLSHREGHSESKSIPLPIDKNEYRTAIQDHGSTISFGRRYLLKMHLNIIETFEDNDGQGGVEPLTEDQIKDIVAAMDEVKMDMPRFFLYMKVGSMAELTQSDMPAILNAIDVKRADNEKKLRK